jgi:predicted nucleic acid-binding protein
MIAAEHRIRGCDAVYVALADQLGDCLITLPGRLAKTCQVFWSMPAFRV